MLGFTLGKTGIMSALPYLAMFLMLLVTGYLADLLQARRILSTTQVRKVFNCGAFLAQTVFMFGVAYVSSQAGAVICLTLAVGLGAFAWGGFR